jgi:hypothetical protein
MSSAMQSAFGTIPTFGCTTAGEIISGKMLRNTVVVMAFSNLIIEDIKIAVMENIKEYPKRAVDKAFETLKSRF